MKFRRAAFAQSLFVGFASQGFAAQSLDAPFIFQKSTAPTGAYYEQNGSNGCGVPGGGSSGTSSGATGTATVCKINFAAPPNGKYLVIEHVACNLVLGGDLLADISLATGAGINEVRLAPLKPTLVSQGYYNYYSLNDTFIYATNAVPRIVLHTENNASLQAACQISGHLNAVQ
jgi:hypothetical protein